MHFVGFTYLLAEVRTAQATAGAAFADSCKMKEPTLFSVSLLDLDILI